MEQQAQVIRIVNNTTARVAVKRKSACSGDCHTCHGCPHPDEIVMVDADNLVGAQKGDDVIVRSDTGRVLKLAAMLAFTFPGSPTVYYGDEAGMEGILICMYVSRSMKKNNKEMHFSIVQVLGE